MPRAMAEEFRGIPDWREVRQTAAPRQIFTGTAVLGDRVHSGDPVRAFKQEVVIRRDGGRHQSLEGEPRENGMAGTQTIAVAPDDGLERSRKELTGHNLLPGEPHGVEKQGLAGDRTL